MSSLGITAGSQHDVLQPPLVCHCAVKAISAVSREIRRYWDFKTAQVRSVFYQTERPDLEVSDLTALVIRALGGH